MLMPGLDHFARDLLARLPDATGWEVRPFAPPDFRAALAWTDNAATDAVWFEFCWPPFPQLIAQTDFAGRRVIVRVHRIEAYETGHVARTSWAKVDDVVVVSHDMARLVRKAVPGIDWTTRVQVVHNGLDLDRFAPLAAWEPFRIGWCGLLNLRKNPSLALQILFRLRALDRRYALHCCAKGGDPVALDSFLHLARRLNLNDAVHIDGTVAQSEMPAWHARNGVLLSTSLHESFGYAIAEAASVGCDLAVLDHLGADEFWPPQTRFASIDEAVALIRHAAPHRWRDVAEQYSLPKQLAALGAMLNGEAASAPARPTHVNGFSSADYWESRYRQGGNSGAGSYGRLARFKAEIVNAFVRDHAIASVIEFGSGDGAQLALAEYPSYVGVDVSPTAVALCRQRFAADSSKHFHLARGSARELGAADLALSLDVVFHLVEDAVFDAYMRDLFGHARRFVIIYASDEDAATRDAHVRHRRFTDWIARNADGWQRIAHIGNRYGFDPSQPADTSFCDFHIFARTDPAAPANAEMAGSASERRR
jgi:hypothetical protein